MNNRILSLMLCLCMAFGFLAGSAQAADVIPVTGIDTAGKVVLKAGETTTWKASVVPSNATDPFLWWTAGNPGVATVDQNGRITTYKAGKCNITVTAKNGVKKTVLLTVTGGSGSAAVPVTGIRTSGKTTIKVGERVRWTASAVPSNATDPFLWWTAGNPGVATVDQKGNIKALKAGKCHITVTAKNGVKKTVLLTVTDANSGYSQYNGNYTGGGTPCRGSSDGKIYYIGLWSASISKATADSLVLSFSQSESNYVCGNTVLKRKSDGSYQGKGNSSWGISYFQVWLLEKNRIKITVSGAADTTGTETLYKN